MSRFIVYGLIDPRNGELRYVGKSSVGLTRPKAHRCNAILGRERTYKANWIRQLKAIGLDYEIEVLEELSSSDELNDAEVFWIQYFRFIGCRLTNLTDGGDGTPGRKRSLEERQRVSEALRGRKLTIEHKAKLSRIRRGKPTPWMVGRVVSDATRAKISKSLTGRPAHHMRGNDYGRKNAGKVRTANMRAEASKARGGKPFTDDLGNRFCTLSEAAAFHGLSLSNIQSVLKGRRKTTGGRSFKYED